MQEVTAFKKILYDVFEARSNADDKSAIYEDIQIHITETKRGDK